MRKTRATVDSSRVLGWARHSPKKTAAPASQRGMATVEIALGVLSLAALTMLLGWVVNLGLIQARCQDTASQIARQLARGDHTAAERAGLGAPTGATVHVRKAEGDVIADVGIEVSFFGVDSLRLSATARYPLEPGVR